MLNPFRRFVAAYDACEVAGETEIREKADDWGLSLAWGSGSISGLFSEKCRKMQKDLQLRSDLAHPIHRGLAEGMGKYHVLRHTASFRTRCAQQEIIEFVGDDQGTDSGETGPCCSARTNIHKVRHILGGAAVNDS
jgi:hypothetical protein